MPGRGHGQDFRGRKFVRDQKGYPKFTMAEIDREQAKKKRGEDLYTEDKIDSAKGEGGHEYIVAGVWGNSQTGE